MTSSDNLFTDLLLDEKLPEEVDAISLVSNWISENDLLVKGIALVTGVSLLFGIRWLFKKLQLTKKAKNEAILQGIKEDNSKDDSKDDSCKRLFKMFNNPKDDSKDDSCKRLFKMFNNPKDDSKDASKDDSIVVYGNYPNSCKKKKTIIENFSKNMKNLFSSVNFLASKIEEPKPVDSEDNSKEKLQKRHTLLKDDAMKDAIEIFKDNSNIDSTKIKRSKSFTTSREGNGYARFGRQLYPNSKDNSETERVIKSWRMAEAGDIKKKQEEILQKEIKGWLEDTKVKIESETVKTNKQEEDLLKNQMILLEKLRKEKELNNVI